jgi:MFS transporter
VRRLFSRGVNLLAFTRAAPFYARYTMRFHLPAEMLLGVYAGVFGLAEIVTRKTLHASDLVLSLQSSVPMMALVFAMVWREILDGVDGRKVLVLTGLLGKGLLIAVAAVTSPIALLMLCIFLFVVDSAFIPVRNAIFRANYVERVRGRMFGWATTAMCLAMIISNHIAAGLLDDWGESYRILLPVAGIFGLCAHLLYARIRVRGSRNGASRGKAPAVRTPILKRAARPFLATVRLLKSDAEFRAYERNFFIYGLAFLMNLPLIVMLIVDELKLDYGSAALSRIIVPQIMMVVLSPFVGKLLDRSHPARLMAGGSVLLAIHAALLFVTYREETLYVSFALFGIAMTAIHLAWNLGPIHFAREERDSPDYMAVHVTLTGLRAIIGPALALGAKYFLGLRAGFAVSAGLYLLAAILMYRLSRRVSYPDAPDPVESTDELD